MSLTDLPFRPRLAEHAMARRHLVDGEEIVVVHDTRSGDLVRMPPRAWTLIEAADGTREIGGLLLAAAQKGALHRTSELLAVLTSLHAAGLLTDGIDPFALAPAASTSASDPATPLDVLPFALTCDGSGSCCATYSTVRFTEAEAGRARALLPGAREAPEPRAHTFLPLAGSGAQPSLAVAAIDGRCGYLAEDGACALHRAHGPEAKPAACAIYPATFIDDGEAIRVSLGVECACVAKSLGNKDGVPLVPAAARTRAELPAGAQIALLPAAIELRAGVLVAREAVVRWSRVVLAASWPEDAVALLWALAAQLAEGDFSEGAVRAALATATAPPASEVMPWIQALFERTAAKQETAERWRSGRDRVRIASRLLAQTAASLHNADALADVLAGHGAARDVEAFYVRANLHGHALLGELPLTHALRDRAVRILLSRAVPQTAARIQCDDPGREHPLPLVEAMMRAQGVKEYARQVPGASSAPPA